MELFPHDSNFNFMKMRWVSLTAAALLMFVALGAMAVNGFNYALDFTGGTVTELKFDKAVDEVYLSGGASRLRFLGEAFEKIFEKRVRAWDPTENLKIDESTVDTAKLKENASQIAIAVGLASRILKD